VSERTYISLLTGDCGLAEVAAPLPLAELVPGTGPWEVEIGFGKGRYLLRRSREEPERRFLGIEIAGKYQRRFVEKARRLPAGNWMALRGDALYLLSAVLPTRFAETVHVYFPDPWPKSRQQKRRLFDPETVDLVVGLLADGGRLLFATDFLEYGEKVHELLASYPGLEVVRRDRWEEGPRTSYEAKYELEGRPILRLEARLEARFDTSWDARSAAPLHPRGTAAVLAATFKEKEEEE
jgi:tRNA (guanine-N7-)-methyltransferase